MQKDLETVTLTTGKYKNTTSIHYYIQMEFYFFSLINYSKYCMVFSSVGPNTISDAIARQQQQQQSHSDPQQMNQSNGQNNNMSCGDMTPNTNRYHTPSISDYHHSSGVGIYLVFIIFVNDNCKIYI